MSNIRWKNAVSGDFANAKLWSGGIVPGVNDIAALDRSGGPFTVTSSADETLAGIQLSANATLNITGGTFIATGGTGGGANAGTIAVTGAAAFGIGGVVDNANAILLSQATRYSDTPSLEVLANTTLSGGGKVVLGSDGTYGNIRIADGVVLTNVDNTISGAGSIGRQNIFTIVNDPLGVITTDPHTSGFLTIGHYLGPPTTLTNYGLIDAGPAPAAAIAVNNAIVNGTGGRISAETGGHLFLDDCKISGQTLLTSVGGAIVTWHSAISLGGQIENAGSLQLDHSTRATIIQDLTLTGGGELRVDKKDKWISKTKNVTITNVDNVITGGGTLGSARFTIINAAGGVISGSHDRQGKLILTIDTGVHTIVNAGRIQTAAGGGLDIDSPVNNMGQILSIDGRITVNGAVTGSGSVSIVSSGGPAWLAFKSSFNQDVTFLGGNGGLELAHSQDFTASVTGFSTGGGGDNLDLDDIAFVNPGEATFSGAQSGGVLTVSDGVHSAHIQLIGDYRSTQFVAASDGKGGTRVTAQAAPALHGLTAAMATLGVSPGAVGHSGAPPLAPLPTLAAPPPTT